MKDLKPAALVTGAAKRIGRTIALDLAGHGWNVAIHYRHSRAEAEEVVRAAKTFGVEAVAVGAELADEKAARALLPVAAEALGPITLLVNNAAIFEADEALSATRQSWDAHMETNLRAPFVLAQELMRQLPPAVTGNIVNIIDQRVWRLTPKFMTYTLSKAGLWTLTQTMALALAPRVRVNAVGPGPVLPSPRQSAADFAAQAAALPLGRHTSPEEITRAVRFILESPSMTGQMIALDGGQHLSWQTADTLADE
ncbi:MAG: SDR family oxidoreductase [Sphingomonadales bacterium]|nr:SDR family oxidoreductase [Sphingomonadales bacterium]